MKVRWHVRTLVRKCLVLIMLYYLDYPLTLPEWTGLLWILSRNIPRLVYICVSIRNTPLSFSLCSSLSVCLHIPFNLLVSLKYVNNESQVVTLLTKMEELNEKVFHPNIHSAMDGWLDSTRKVQARRKEEIINATNRHRSGAPRNHDERGKHCAVCVVTAYLKACA